VSQITPHLRILVAVEAVDGRRGWILLLSYAGREGVGILVANCLAHGRRQFIEMVQSSPQECRHVLEALGRVYYHDAQARRQSLSAPERLRFHPQHSGLVMEELHEWLEAQLTQKKTEPNFSPAQSD
jgi:transposase IS66 family protein